MLTTVDADAVTWRLPDPDGRLGGVRLWADFDLGDTGFARVDGGWALHRPRRSLPPVDRLEYLLETSDDAGTHSLLDPGNPRRVGGAFGDHSWVSLDYRPPAWLTLTPHPGRTQPLRVSGTPVGDVDAQLWSPDGVPDDEPLPLLLSHDGPEMDALGRLTQYVGAMLALRQAQGAERSAQGTDGSAPHTEGSGLPPFRVGLLAPGPRDERYAANPAYADALVRHVLPALAARVATRGRPVLMGQSLGAVAALHAEWTHPGTFAGLLLQSGSFFTPELDAQERGYAHWDALTGFVDRVHTAERAPGAPPVAVVFGSAEENAANNRLLAATLRRLGVDVGIGSVRDGHCFTCWRDLLHPHLTTLLGDILLRDTVHRTPRES